MDRNIENRIDSADVLLALLTGGVVDAVVFALSKLVNLLFGTRIALTVWGWIAIWIAVSLGVLIWILWEMGRKKKNAW